MDFVNVDLLFKIAGIGILLMVFTSVLNQADKKEQAQLLTLAGVVMVMMFVIRMIGELFEAVRTIFQIY